MRRRSRILIAALAGAALVGGVLVAVGAATWPDVAALATANPETTAFIERYRAARRAENRPDAVILVWVSWDALSPHVPRAVVAAEDMEFFQHDGFSTSEMRAALRDAWERREMPRGASTITQQLAKNLWLTPSRNPLRKIREALLTRQLERHLSKRRILELYLNVVEFGPGVYGVGAAARHYFGTSAAHLTEEDAAQLAAGLPRPSRWHPGVESESYSRYVAEIRRRTDAATFIWRHIGAAPPPSLAVPDGLGDSVRERPPDSTPPPE